MSGASEAPPNDEAGSQQSINPPSINAVTLSIIRRTGKVPAGLLETLKQGSRRVRGREEEQKRTGADLVR